MKLTVPNHLWYSYCFSKFEAFMHGIKIIMTAIFPVRMYDH